MKKTSHIRFIGLVQDVDHGIQLSLFETQLLQDVLDVGPLCVELWVAEISHIHKDILKVRVVQLGQT